MNRKVWLLSVMWALFSTVVFAVEEQKIAKPDLVKGEALFNMGASDRNIPACTSCHGAGGNSAAAINPTLAGQHAEYTIKQLMNFKVRTERDHPVMSPYARALSDQEIRDMAAYLEKQVSKPGSAKNKASIALGQKIYRAGIAEKAVPACASCHDPTGAGIPIQYPRIGGQWADYTVSQLSNFRSGERKNSPQMHDIAIKLTDA